MKEVPLTHGMKAVVDDADFGLLSRCKWRAMPAPNTYYAVRAEWIKGIRSVRVAFMHRMILGLQRDDPRKSDHRDGDGLNNTRANLRIVSHAQNARNRRLHDNNTSGYKGVHWSNQSKAWIARISYNGIRYHLGTFASPQDAAKAYDQKAVELHGEFARINFA